MFDWQNVCDGFWIMLVHVVECSSRHFPKVLAKSDINGYKLFFTSFTFPSFECITYPYTHIADEYVSTFTYYLNIKTIVSKCKQRLTDSQIQCWQTNLYIVCSQILATVFIYSTFQWHLDCNKRMQFNIDVSGVCINKREISLSNGMHHWQIKQFIVSKWNRASAHTHTHTSAKMSTSTTTTTNNVKRA